jgi:hypothetical protein
MYNFYASIRKKKKCAIWVLYHCLKSDKVLNFFGGWDWGVNSGLHTFKAAYFSLVILEMGSYELFTWADLQLPCLLLISASQVARITGGS